MKRSNIFSFFAVAVCLTLMGVGCLSSTVPTTSAPIQSGMDNSISVKVPITESAPSPSAAKKINAAIAGFSFQPASITVSVGDTVTWTNNDSAPHTVTAYNGSFDSGTIPYGGTFTHTFTTLGTIAFNCSFHDSMRGQVIVGQ